MGGDRRPAADKTRMLGTPAAPDGREFGHAWRALVGEFGPPAPRSLLRLAMMRCAARWVALAAATRVLTDARRARIEGKGRRPSQREIDRLSKRAALEDGSYEQALNQIRELHAAHAPTPPRPSAQDILASLAPVARPTER